MNQEHWLARIKYVVQRANEGYPNNLHLLAQRLADLDLAVDALVDAGFGQPGDDIREIADNIITHAALPLQEEVHGQAPASV